MDAALASIITGGITAAVTVISILASNRKSDAIKETRQEERDNQMRDWQQRVEGKLDEHNQYGKKFGEVAASFSDLKITLARLDERMNNIEKR